MARVNSDVMFEWASFRLLALLHTQVNLDLGGGGGGGGE